MNHTVVSWRKFCEWMQGKKVCEEIDVGRSTALRFEDGTEAVIYSNFERRFGELSIEPPMVSVKEKSP